MLLLYCVTRFHGSYELVSPYLCSYLPPGMIAYVLKFTYVIRSSKVIIDVKLVELRQSYLCFLLLFFIMQ